MALALYVLEASALLALEHHLKYTVRPPHGLLLLVPLERSKYFYLRN